MAWQPVLETLTLGTAPHWYFDDEPMYDCPFHIPTCHGCDGTVLPINLKMERISNLNHLDYLPCPKTSFSRPRSMTRSTSINLFDRPEATRMQMKEGFLKLYFPVGISDHDSDSTYSKFLTREALERLAPTINAAVDALCLTQLGIAHSDRRLIHQAQKRYQAAVANFNADLAGTNAMVDDGPLRAVYLLGVCQVHPFSASPSKHPYLNDLSHDPWRPRHSGLSELLLVRGPNSQYSKFAQLLSYNFRHVVAIIGYTERKEVIYTGPSWKKCSALTDGIMAALSEQFISVPAVLGKADRAMQRPQRQIGELFAVLTELSSTITTEMPQPNDATPLAETNMRLNRGSPHLSGL